MDFWKDTHGGTLYAHGRECSGETGGDADELIDGALLHDAKTHEPLWMPWSHFEARFEYVELRTSQEAWEGGGHWYFMLGFIAALLGVGLLVTLVIFAWSDVPTRPSAWPISAIFICASVLAFRRSSKLADNYQWHSWKRELKEGQES